jgi:hypothetical protein
MDRIETMKVIITGALLAICFSGGAVNALQCGSQSPVVRSAASQLTRKVAATKNHARRRHSPLGNPGALGCIVVPRAQPVDYTRPIPAELFWVSPNLPVLAPQASK